MCWGLSGASEPTLPPFADNSLHVSNSAVSAHKIASSLTCQQDNGDISRVKAGRCGFCDCCLHMVRGACTRHCR